jgi:hypothetical protein
MIFEKFSSGHICAESFDQIPIFILFPSTSILPLVAHELLTYPENLRSPSAFCGFRVEESL